MMHAKFHKYPAVSSGKNYIQNSHKTINMKKKFYILILIVALLTLTAVSAQENQTLTAQTDQTVMDADCSDEKLEKTRYYDADTGKLSDDDTVITHNVVKYYGDKDTKFRVKVYDINRQPKENESVSFSYQFKPYIKKTTDKNGIVCFNINYKVGTYDVETYIESEDGKSFWSAFNTVKIKSTIAVNELVKYSTSKKKFKLKFLDSKGKALDGKYVKVKIKGKTYKLKTNSKGIVKIKSTRFKVGKDKITVYNPVSGEKRNIPVVVLKKGIHKKNIRIDDPTGYFPTKKLKNGDRIHTVYAAEYRQYEPGVYVQSTSGGYDSPKHTKLIKAKFFFKNKKTGKIITKTSKKVKNNCIVIKPVKGYSPYKATVWYRDRK